MFSERWLYYLGPTPQFYVACCTRAETEGELWQMSVKRVYIIYSKS